MKTSSGELGTVLGFQFVAALQTPPLALVQVIEAAPAGKMKAAPRIWSPNTAVRARKRGAECNKEGS